MLITSLALLTLMAADPKDVAPNRDWTGVVKDDTLLDRAPKDGLITDAKSFEKVWKAWRGPDKVPTIDFTKEFVAVTLAKGGPNVPGIQAKLHEGKLTIVARTTLIAGPGFGYSLATFDRAGVKQVGDAKLP